MTDQLILVLDEGTTSTRAMLFARDGDQRGVAQRDITQFYPADGWVEHDAAEIWDKTLTCARQMVAQAGGAANIAAIGITNQRETLVAWDKESGEALARAIVWQDRRTASYCNALKAAGHEAEVRAKTGLLLDPYFSASKMYWLLENEPQVKAAADRGTLAFGTIESWLVWKLTAGERHITDASNASRTMLMPLESADWDQGLCELFGVPASALPQIVGNVGAFGETRSDFFGAPIPICGLAGDQQAATIGQNCLAPGATKATFGTGAFVLSSTGTRPRASGNRLLTTVLCQLDAGRLYALEGSVFVAGSLIQYLRDSLGLISHASETEALARSVPDSGGVVVVPALSGLGAPHWRPEARASISGLSFASSKAHIVRAALEAMAHQSQDMADAFAADGAPWRGMKIDGGMAANDWMAQDIADLLDLPVTRPDFVETTALGAAMLAGLGCGWFASLDQAAVSMSGTSREFLPQIDEAPRAARKARWQAAIERV